MFVCLFVLTDCRSCKYVVSYLRSFDIEDELFEQRCSRFVTSRGELVWRGFFIDLTLRSVGSIFQPKSEKNDYLTPNRQLAHTSCKYVSKIKYFSNSSMCKDFFRPPDLLHKREDLGLKVQIQY